MLQLKNGVDPWLTPPGTILSDLFEDTDTALLPRYHGTVTVASRGNLSDYLEYTYEGINPVWCLGILYLKAKSVSTIQSIAFRMLIGSMSVAECTLDYHAMSYTMLPQSRYLAPVLLHPGTTATLGIWLAADGTKITNLDGNYEIRLFGRT